MRIATSLIVLTVALAIAAPAAAQATGTSSSRQKPSTSKPKPPLPKPVMNIRAFGAFDVEFMSASRTFDAVTGSPVMLGYGGGAEIVNLWKRLFVRGDFTTSSASGTRVFALGDDVISTGIPIGIRLSTVEAVGGWRMPLRKTPKYTPYFGGGVVFVMWSEESDLAADGDDVSASFPGYELLGGVDIQLKKRWAVSAEAQYRFVPNAIGGAGISLGYSEDDLGGFVARVMVGYNLLKKK